VRIAVVSLFPEMITAAAQWGVTGRALERGLWSLAAFNPRDFASGVHRAVDDRPYGGGPGMVMLHEPLAAAINAAKAWATTAAPVVMLSPQGARFDQRTARRWSAAPSLIFVCGRYEGVDQRTLDGCITESVSLGDFVLSGGELGALAVTDAVVRLLPGVLNDAQSAQQESFSFGLLDHPHYTRPPILANGAGVPDVLLSGDHAAIAEWRREQALTLTFRNRPDLLAQAPLSDADLRFLRKLGYTSR
jgi:tRNA (guanine37-N1)-methyltransferase